MRRYSSALRYASRPPCLNPPSTCRVDWFDSKAGLIELIGLPMVIIPHLRTCTGTLGSSQDNQLSCTAELGELMHLRDTFVSGL